MQEIMLDFVITATDCSSLEICEMYLLTFFMVISVVSLNADLHSAAVIVVCNIMIKWAAL